jgi:ribose 5-phosphate isomerase B
VRIALAVDHAGFPLKQTAAEAVARAGFALVDLGAHSVNPSDDYPDYAEAVGEAIRKGQADRGIVICGSGVGACVAANKLPAIRACVCHDTYSAHQGVEHDDMNVLCLGARVVGAAVASEIVAAFLAARFSGEERHLRRLSKTKAIEARFLKA